MRQHIKAFARKTQWGTRESTALFAAALLVAAFALHSPAHRAPLSSAETRFVENSASGLQIVPASCPSHPHLVCVSAGGCGPGGQNSKEEMENCSIGNGDVPGGGGPGGGGGGGGGGGSPSNPPPSGWFDSAACDYVSGWSCDASDYNYSVEVHIQEGAGVGQGTLWGSFMANSPVAGNPAVCGGTPNHQFKWAIPDALKDGVPHTLYAYALDYPSGGGNFYALSGNPKTIQCNRCTPQYFCSGSDLYYKNSRCTDSFVQHCAWGCNGDRCSPPPAPTGSIKANPALIHAGETSVITWTSHNAQSCVVTEDNGDINDTWTGTSGSQTSSKISKKTHYVLACQGFPGANPPNFTDQATVNIIPVFQEK